MMPYYYGHMGGGGAGPIGFVIVVVLAIIFFVFIFGAIRMAMWRGGAMRHHIHGMMGPGEKPLDHRALDMLKERFVKGEITKDQYLDMKKTLEA